MMRNTIDREMRRLDIAILFHLFSLSPDLCTVSDSSKIVSAQYLTPMNMRAPITIATTFSSNLAATDLSMHLHTDRLSGEKDKSRQSRVYEKMSKDDLNLVIASK